MIMNLLFVIVSLFATLVTAQVSASTRSQFRYQSMGRTIVLGGTSYFISPIAVSQLKIGKNGKTSKLLADAASDFAGEFIPMTIVHTAEKSFGEAEFEKTITSYKERDDVFSDSFLAGVFIKFTGRGRPSATLSFSGKVHGTSLILKSDEYPDGFSLTDDLPTGPYFLDPHNGNFYQAFRLYSDTQMSFVYGTIPDGRNGYQQLNAQTDGAATKTIAVPSRLYFTPTPEKPLAGLRLAVKDIFDVKGLRTGCGNRAYYDLYPEKTKTAPAVQRLLDGGMILIGKTKTSQFANDESAPSDWVDFHPPYNPRGDGYQDGSSSSTGSGTSMAAYDWLDFAIGSDTGGSMRGPAAANGIYGNRPSYGAIPTDNTMPLSPSLDTVGLFSRCARGWSIIANWWYKGMKSYTSFPKKIIFPVDLFGSKGDASSAMYNDFVTKLEKFLGTKRTEMNFAETWTKTKPSNVTASTLGDLLNTTYADLITSDQVALVADPFIKDFKAANGGRAPFINPVPTVQWNYGRSLSSTKKRAALEAKTTFMNWFSQNVVKSNKDTCSDSIFLYPQSRGAVSYRNHYGGSPSLPLGFSAGRIAVYAEVPDMVVPIGEIPYTSEITGTQEYLPVSISFIAAKNCDLMLFNLLRAVQEAGIIKQLTSGSRLYSAKA